MSSGSVQLCRPWQGPGRELRVPEPATGVGSKHLSVTDLCLQSGASNFGEKFSRVKFSPSLTLFGGKPMEGWIAVTISGLVTVSLLKPNGQVLTSTESLCRLRCRVALADVAFTGGGNIVVATSDGSSTSPVQFYKVCVSVVNEKCKIDTEILPSLFMRCTTDPARKDKYPAITHLKFLARDMSEQVSVCCQSRQGLSEQQGSSGLRHIWPPHGSGGGRSALGVDDRVLQCPLCFSCSCWKCCPEALGGALAQPCSSWKSSWKGLSLVSLIALCAVCSLDLAVVVRAALPAPGRVWGGRSHPQASTSKQPLSRLLGAPDLRDSI